ncbi:MAG: hypothetical protein AB1861_18095 [Cyanobacteriota bacterium]
MTEVPSPINPIPASEKFAIACELAKLLEAQERLNEWNFPDAVTLEIHEPLLRRIDCGSGAELLNQFVGVGGEIIDYDFYAEPKTWGELRQLLSEAYS